MTTGVQDPSNDERFRVAVETISDCVGVYRALRDAQGQITDFLVEYVNDAACRSNQLTREAQLGRGLCELLPSHRGSGLFVTYCRVVETRLPFADEAFVYTDVYGGKLIQRVFDIRVSPLEDGFIATWRDVTEQRRIQAQSLVLDLASRTLAASLDYTTTLAAVAELAVPTLADMCLVYLLDDHGALFDVGLACADPNHTLVMREMLEQYPPDPASSPSIADVLRTRATVLEAELPPDLYRVAGIDAHHSDLIQRISPRSFLTVPLQVEQDIRGILQLVWTQPGRQYEGNDVTLVEELARRCAQAIERARLYRTEQQARARAEQAEHALREWNTTLEQRVAERTAQLAAEVLERQRDAEALRTANRQLAALTAQLTRSRNVLQTLFDGLDDGLLLLDHTGTVQVANHALAELFNAPLERVLQSPWALVCASLHPPCPVAWVLDTLRTGQAEQRRVRYTPDHGRTRVLDVRTLPLPAGDDLLAQVIVHFTDTTERLQLETIAIQSERYIASATLAAMVAHEVNTPLQAVKNFLYLVNDAEAEERQHFLQLAREELRRIGTIVEQFLDLYRPMTGEPGPVDLQALISRVLLLTRLMCERQQVTVVVPAAPTLPTLWGRADQLVQLILNLVINALEAMPAGGTLTVSGSVETHSEAPVAPAIVLRVSDTGAGIPDDLIPLIFEPFFTTKAHGTGLGLAMCQTIAAQHGGSIQIERRETPGATFAVTLPLTSTAD